MKNPVKEDGPSKLCRYCETPVAFKMNDDNQTAVDTQLRCQGKEEHKERAVEAEVAVLALTQ